MIRCKATFHLARCAFWFTVFTAANLVNAQAYLVPPVYGFEKGIIDYEQRHLSDNLRFLLYRSEFSVLQQGYSNSSGNLANLQIATDFAAMARSGLGGLAPDTIDRDLYNAERFAVRLYENMARRWDSMNPIPGLNYSLLIRNAAYPFIFLESVENIARDFSTFPFTDDLKFRDIALTRRQFGFAFQIVF